MFIRLLLFFFFALTTPLLYSQVSSNFCKQTEAIQKLILKEHIQPKAINDSLSAGVYDLFLKSLDDNHQFFTESDLLIFQEDRYNIDDFLSKNECSFIEKYIVALEKRLIDTKEFIKEITNQPLDFSGKDSIHFKPEKTLFYFKNEERAKKYWNKKVRYTLLAQLFEEDSIYENVEKNFNKLEKELKPKIIQKELCLVDELINQTGGIKRFVQESFLNAYANYQDPNTSFFNNYEKNSFETSLSNNKLSFGFFTSKNDNGDFTVDYISPGSPAHKNENFEEGDIIKSMRFGNEVLETFCVSSEDIHSFMQDSKHLSLNFKLKKKNGATKIVKLIKDEIKVEENSVRGFILGDTSAIGYIQIPSFYTDFESSNGLGLANDVAKELYKLEKEHINGLIIDLRFNGGGSIKEATDLCGMFINRGPLAILKYKNGETYTIRDGKRGMLFNKPIAVIINSYSASASELFSGVMQDYNRAIIVGTPSYGKSSAQVILPLNENEELGYCKVTIDQFYRVTGKSSQSEGIIPDIKFPSVYDQMKTSEMYLKHSLLNDTTKVTLKHNPFNAITSNKIITNSVERIKLNTGFKNIQLLNEVILTNYVNKNSKYPLTLYNIHSDLKRYYGLWNNAFKKLENYTSLIPVKNSVSTNEVLSYNQDDKEINNLTLNEISNDIYIEETFNLLTEVIASKKTP
ncbi:MAG: hypothetical protein KUG68_11910 [Flavobacteriaceae bacterium]|nr:hypothetical protein [Flavobacteriaceae bacterium]